MGHRSRRCDWSQPAGLGTHPSRPALWQARVTLHAKTQQNNMTLILVIVVQTCVCPLGRSAGGVQCVRWKQLHRVARPFMVPESAAEIIIIESVLHMKPVLLEVHVAHTRMSVASTSHWRPSTAGAAKNTRPKLPHTVYRLLMLLYGPQLRLLVRGLTLCFASVRNATPLHPQ